MKALTPEQVAALLKPKQTVNQPVSREGLTWCEFCKGYYNEYHFGDIDE